MAMQLFDTNDFQIRHLGPNPQETADMLAAIGVGSLDELVDQTVPERIRLRQPLRLDQPMSEYELLTHLRALAAKNVRKTSYLGQGYGNCITPAAIQRNIFENPGWYTQYTPYQPEISQGRLEALLNFQTMVADLTGMKVANASLLDEGTAAAEAMAMAYGLANKSGSAKRNKFFVSARTFRQTIDVVTTRAIPHGIEVVVGNHEAVKIDGEYFGALVQYPGEDGAVTDLRTFIGQTHAAGAVAIVATDLLALTLLTPPGEFGADIVVGNSQRFGIPMGYGGPHAAFFATKEEYIRVMPGRIIGVSIDSQNDRAYRMTLQTREQHIRREKATSNICTAQALLAVMAGMYAVYHGPEGLRRIASRVHAAARLLEQELTRAGVKQLNPLYFDTLKVECPTPDVASKVIAEALAAGYNLRLIEDKYVGVALDETTSVADVTAVRDSFLRAAGLPAATQDIAKAASEVRVDYPAPFSRTSAYLRHPVFNSYRSETAIMRYIKSLENKDLSLTGSMIPLGSCTMKLNAAVELMPVSWPEFAGLHPFVPADQAKGYHELIRGLEEALCRISGFAASSLQPNSGAQGEFAGLLVIREYHHDHGQPQRNVTLIPSSAHGTNPASAVMAGMQVVVVACDATGNIDVDDLRVKAEQHRPNLAALMVTYPSTHGVFEERIMEICEIVHRNGGLVYMDGANLNAQVGLTSPALIGADVCHINLHKTFAIPHGGGGPGMGPICVTKELAPYLPGHPVVKTGGAKGVHAVSASPWGSASILLISYAYIRLLGGEGLTQATKYAILNANYLKAKLGEHFPVLYQGASGRVAHEFILNMKGFKEETGIEVEDISKRLMDYGFHAPTVSFPVAGTLMIEPTESEPKPELDRFVEAMIHVRQEIQEVADGKADRTDNVLKNAPHTSTVVSADVWSHSYGREKAAFPVPGLRRIKSWPSVGRINSTYGDRNIVCSCPPVKDYE